MPYTVTSDPHLHPWPPSKASHRTLPLPPNPYDLYSGSKQAFAYNSGPPTPPPTSEMNGLPYPGQRGPEISYPVRTQIPIAQPTSNAYKESAGSSNTYIKSSPPGISNLVQAEPQGRQSPSHGLTITSAFKLPSSIKAPQASLPQLAAEVRSPNETWWHGSETDMKR
jgi:hypothetical protein